MAQYLIQKKFMAINRNAERKKTKPIKANQSQFTRNECCVLSSA